MNKVIRYIFWPALAGLVFGLVLLLLPRFADRIPGLEGYLPKAPVQIVSTNSFSYADAISKAAPAVVSINATSDVSRKETEFINPFESQTVLRFDESRTLGSGIIINEEGYIITSNHIFEIQGLNIENSLVSEITVTLNDGRNIEARIVKKDVSNDLALLKVDEENLHSIAISNTREINVGDVVLAIGNPRNLGQSVTFGIISALLRSGDSYVIQTDAAINPGNSGGALIDVDGNLIGINSTIVSESGGSEGISFAIPANKAIALMDSYINAGPNAYLGIDTYLLINEFTGNYYVPLSRERTAEGQTVTGIKVSDVFRNGPADQAGICVDDIILSYDGIKIDNALQAQTFFKIAELKKPGDSLLLEVYRDGNIHEFTTILGVGEVNLSLDLPQNKSNNNSSTSSNVCE